MKYFIVAGEASGDLHGGNLIAALAECDRDAKFMFLGGDKMSAAAGVKPIVHICDMAFMGFVAVLRNFSAIRDNSIKAQEAIAAFCPDRLILIDYPGFNLRFAHWVKKHLPKTEIVYYIAPKLWAWKSYRIHSIKKYVDRMYTIFPFETVWFGKRGYEVTYVGNPTVDSVTAFTNVNGTTNIATSPLDTATSFPKRLVVALLPGSRLQEIKGCLPRMAQLAERFTECKFVVAAAPSVDIEVYRQMVGERVEIVEQSTYQLLSSADAAVVNSGTATLETALFGVPQVVVYNVAGGAFTRLLKRIFIKTRYVSLVNIIAQRGVIVELLADQFTLYNMTTELRKLLYNAQYRAEIRKNYVSIASELGTAGTAERCARAILS